MYRTRRLQELISHGIPDKLRAELWLICSGALFGVSRILRYFKVLGSWVGALPSPLGSSGPLHLPLCTCN